MSREDWERGARHRGEERSQGAAQDTVLVTTSGADVLTALMPKGLDQLRALSEGV